MSLLKVKTILQRLETCSLFDLCKETKTHPDVLRDMLQHWVRKGKVCRLVGTDACGKSCTQCDPLFIERYQWIA